MNVCPTCGQALRTKADIERGKLGSLVFAERIRLEDRVVKGMSQTSSALRSDQLDRHIALGMAPRSTRKLVGILGLDASQVGDLFA